MMLEAAFQHEFPGGFSLDVALRTDAPVTALFGPSGGGKTTTLGVIAGLLRPRRGRVELNGRTLLDTPRGLSTPMRARRIGVVFQEDRLFPHLTVEQNLRFGEPRGERRIALGEIAEALEIADLLARLPRELSGGQRRRVALGRALASDPELLLMDEPLGALDDSLKDRILGYLERTVARWNVATLFVTHSQAEVRRLAQWVAVIDRGRVVAEGPPDEALGRKESLELAGDTSGPLNVLRIEQLESVDGHAVARIGGQAIHLPAAAQALTAPFDAVCAPRDIVLCAEDVSGVSARNHLRGRVVQVTPVSQVVFVEVDVGQRLWCEITPEAARELQLAAGREVVCLIKANSLRVSGSR